MTHVILLALCAAPVSAPATPRLGVMLVVDQLSSAELETLAIDGEADFGGLLARGAARYDAWYPYLATETCPGHATLSTGASPATHGICANHWLSAGKPVYCVDDDDEQVLGAKQGTGRSAKHLLSPTLGDTLKARSPRSRVISLAVKDRAAILLGGPSADLALWYDNEQARFTTSRAWAPALPAWAAALAALPQRAFESAKWSPLPAVARRALDDAREGEASPEGFSATFPHDLSALGAAQRPRAYRLTPSSLDDVFTLTLAAVDGEQLGRRGVPDLLMVSISTTDYAGHSWGPGSVEKVDLLERLSAAIRHLSSELDKRVGPKGWALVLSSDHGVAPLAEQSCKARLRAGRVVEQRLHEEAVAGLTPDAARRVLGVGPPELSLNLEGLSPAEVDSLVTVLRSNLSADPGVMKTYAVSEHPQADDALARLSSYPGRCGPLFYDLRPYYVFTVKDHPLGTDHASGNAYDRRVPLIVTGPGVTAGRYAQPLDPRDAAPSLAAMLSIPPPDRAEGRAAPAIDRH